MSGRLTTQVIDAVRGVPAGGLLIDLFEWPPGGAEVAGDGMHPATFELLFHIGRYFKSRGLAPAGGLDLDVVPVRFAITDANAAYCISFVAGQRFFAVYSAEVPGA